MPKCLETILFTSNLISTSGCDNTVPILIPWLFLKSLSNCSIVALFIGVPIGAGVLGILRFLRSPRIVISPLMYWSVSPPISVIFLIESSSNKSSLNVKLPRNKLSIVPIIVFPSCSK